MAQTLDGNNSDSGIVLKNSSILGQLGSLENPSYSLCFSTDL